MGERVRVRLTPVLPIKEGFFFFNLRSGWALFGLAIFFRNPAQYLALKRRFFLKSWIIILLK